MSDIDWAVWETRFRQFLTEQMAGADVAHDPGHIQRVVKSAKRLAATEGARLEVVVPAAWLHDCVTVPKDSPKRKSASTEASSVAAAFLEAEGYPAIWIPEIRHAIEAHSFSAGLEPKSLEAQVVRDADRLDAIGAIGIGRCFQVGTDLGLAIYHPAEPIPRTRQPDDRRFVVDHFFVKLFKLAEDMRTEAGKAEAGRRTAFMKDFLRNLETDIEGGLLAEEPG